MLKGPRENTALYLPISPSTSTLSALSSGCGVLCAAYQGNADAQNLHAITFLLDLKKWFQHRH